MTSYQPAQRLRFGVIGCADIAWRRTLPAMETDPAIDVVAIASRDGDRARTFTDRFGGTPYAGYQAVAEHEDVDAVYIPLPLMLHAEWIERCLDAGKHVLVEKPMSDGYKESARLLDLARERGLVLLENYMFLYHSQHAAVRKLLADGAIGDLRGFHSAFTIPPKPPGTSATRRTSAVARSSTSAATRSARRSTCSAGTCRWRARCSAATARSTS